MKIKIDNNIPIPLDKLIRRCGYAAIKDRQGQISYVRRLRGYHYPRFHVYIEKDGLTLHLDQKAPSYQGIPAHSAEYEGKILEQEAERIREIIKKELERNSI